MEVSGRRPIGHDDADTGVLCDPCQLDDEQETAESYCTHCSEFLCNVCARVHRKSGATRSHRLLDRDQMPRKKLVSIQERFCSTHDGKPVDYFCGAHKQFYCSVCVTLGHVDCGVVYIDDLAKGFNTSKEHQDLLNRIKDLDDQLGEITTKSQNNLDDVNTCFNKVMSDIKRFREDIKSKLDAMEARILEEATRTRADDLKTLDAICTQSESIEADLKEIKTTLESLDQYRQATQLVISSKKAQCQVKEYESQLREMSQDNRVRSYTFQRNEEFLNILRSSNNIGRLSYGQPEERKVAKQLTQDVGEMLAKNDQKEITARFVKTIHIRDILDGDRICDIVGSVLLTNTTLALADRGNKSVKIVDLNSDTVVCFIRLGDQPIDMTCISPKVILVTSDKKITFLTYDKVLSILKEVPMEAGCHGISYNHNNGLLFVTFNKRPAVKMLDTDGNVLHTLTANRKGQAMFVDPRYIDVSPDGQTLCVSDYSNRTVTCLGMDGQVYHAYRHWGLNKPSGLAVGLNNCIYVIGGRWNLYQIKPHQKHKLVLLKQKGWLDRLQTVVYNTTDKTLYIGSHGNYIYVFKLG